MLHSKLTIIDGLYFTTGSANHVDISFHSDPLNGHTEINFGISGKNAVNHVLKQTLPFLLGSQWKPEIMDLPFTGIVELLKVTAKRNRELVETDRAIITRIVEMDLKWALNRRNQVIKTFNLWKGNE